MNISMKPLQGGAVALSALTLSVFAGGNVQTATRSAPPKKAPAKPNAKPGMKPTGNLRSANAPARSTSIPLPGAALGAPPAGLAPDPTFKDASLVVDFSSNWQGYLEPCG